MLLTFVRNITLLVFFILNFTALGLAKNQNYVEHEHVSIKLISSIESISTNKEIYLGLHFKLKPDWKIYWKYPGKAGYPPEINSSNSKNIKNIEILWPKPKKFEILGMESIGYSNEVVLPIKTNLETINNEVLVNFNIDYLTCKKICVPFNDNLKLIIPVGDGQSSEYEKIINKYIDKSNYLTYSSFFNQDSIFFFLFIAFIGGLILNFMPCVFPVLSIKIYNILSQKQKNINYRKIKNNFLATVLVIIFSFLVLSFVTVILKNLGQNIGWGFQFQSPYFLTFMIFILIIFSLNLMDVFLIDIPNSFKSHLIKVINISKKNSDFFHNFFLGTLVTVLSTPCSAPFLGTALGFAFLSSNLTIFLIFFCISLGLSFPYIILATSPKILSYLPKPGIWMKKLKYFLSFLLISTAFWLFTVLLIQINITNNKFKNDSWEKFDQLKLNKLINEKNIIFVDITADWCLTCFYNKTTVINRKKIKMIFNENKVIKMRGDITKPNKKITEYINSFGRYGIPVNILYSSSSPQGILLSEVLTVSELLSTFESIKND